MPTFTYIQNEGDLKTEQDALAREEQALNAAAEKLSARKVAEARRKIADAQKRINEAIKDKPESDLAEAAARNAAETTADTHALIMQDSRPKEVQSSSGFSEVVPIVAIVFCFGWLSIKAIVNAFVGRGANRQAGRLSADDQAIVEKLQRSLTQMESRVESLETILVETRRAKESYGTKF